MIYVVGHKNPDVDAVCSSIAFSYLKNSLGMVTVPKILGQINNGTKYALEYFKVDCPSYLNDVKVQIKDLNFEKKAFIKEDESIGAAIDFIEKKGLNAISIVNKKNILTGHISLKAIVNYITENSSFIETSLDNITNLTCSKIICKSDDIIAGNVNFVTCSNDEYLKNNKFSNDTILVVGDRYKIIEKAINASVKLIILTKDRVLPEKLVQKAKVNHITIISSKYNTAHLCKIIPLTSYIKNVKDNNDLVTVNYNDYYTDFISLTKRHGYTSYPVIKNNGECLGVIKLTNIYDYEKKNVILVDHNSYEQSVDGLEEANIVEIVDHHNLGDIGTSSPISITCMPVGCTATIIYEMYVKEKVKIPKDMAGLMLSSIISDTLYFTSPTTTEKDKNAATALSKIAKVDLNDYAINFLKASSSIKNLSVKELIFSDFKNYVINDKNYGIAVITTMDYEQIMGNINEYITKLNELCDLNYKAAILFITDILKKGSYVIYSDSGERLIKDAFDLKNIEEGIFLENIISRKKQIIPAIMKVLD